MASTTQLGFPIVDNLGSDSSMPTKDYIQLLTGDKDNSMVKLVDAELRKRAQKYSKTLAEWEADTTTIIAAGEFGYAIDTKQIKFGDGVNAWRDLPEQEMGVADGAVTNDKLANMPAKSLKGNVNDNLATPSDIPFSDILELIGGQAIIQYEVMPASVTEGAVVQYVGEDTDEYTNGSWYRGENGEWVLVSGCGEVYDPTITADTKTDINGILSGNGTNVVGLTPAETRTNIGAASNPNLLDNWDFRNPVNQRGETEYTASTSWKYSIDRWRMFNTSVSILNESTYGAGVKVTALDTNTGYKRFQQIVPINLPEGTQITISAIVSSVSVTTNVSMRILRSVTGVLDDGSFSIPNNIEQPTLITKTAILDRDINTIGFELYSTNESNYGWDITIHAVKLEIGEVSTLENDPPADYATELAKCQRFFQKISNASSAYTVLGGAAATISETQCFSVISTPVTMRIKPTCILGGNVGYFQYANGAQTIYAISGVTVGGLVHNGIYILYTISGATRGNMGFIRANNDSTAYIELSADL